MKVTFIYPGFESIGVGYLSAVLKEGGHETHLSLDPLIFADTIVYNGFLSRVFDWHEYVIKDVIESKPDILAMSVATDTYKWAVKYARELKKLIDVKTVFGGIHVSTMPEQVILNDAVDYVVLGEGEYPLLDLVNSLENKDGNRSIPNVWFKEDSKIIKNDVRPLISDLDTLPTPDKELFFRTSPNLGRYLYWTSSSRGCMFRCSFCSNNVLKDMYKKKGRYQRRRTVENMVSELEEAKKKYPFTRVFFSDETFNYDNKWLEEFAEEYPKRVGKPYFCQVHPNLVNETTAKLMRKSMCYSAELGVETLDDDLRREVLNRRETVEDIKNAVNLLESNDIRCSVEHLLGIPGQTIDDVIHIANFYNENRPSRVQCFWLTYYPRLEITKKAIEMGIIKPFDYTKENDSVPTTPFLLGGMSFDKEINKLFTLFSFYLYLPKKLNKIIIDKKLYRYLPSFKSLPPIVTKTFSRAHAIHILQIFRKYTYFMRRKLMIFIGLEKM